MELRTSSEDVSLGKSYHKLVEPILSNLDSLLIFNGIACQRRTFTSIFRAYKKMRLALDWKVLPLKKTISPSNFNSYHYCYHFIENAGSFILGELIYLYCPPSFHQTGRTVENKGKLVLTEIFPSVQNHGI